MSRSRKKTPIIGWTTATSEKDDKRLANRTFRSRNRQRLRKARDYEDLSLFLMQEVSNDWRFAKDGRYWRDRSDGGSKLLRK